MGWEEHKRAFDYFAYKEDARSRGSLVENFV